MSLIKPLSAKFKKNDLDVNGKPLMLLDTVHRTAFMSVLYGKSAAGQNDFKDPDGKVGYYGFGADGMYYSNGVLGRTWHAGESIDDFSDKVKDAARWSTVGGSLDFTEGGLDWIADAPFGKRLCMTYTGPGAEVYDRKGLMTCSPGNNQIALSSRLSTLGEGSAVGTGLNNGIFLGIQPQAVNADYVFVGYCNTGTYSFALVSGHVVAGTPTVTGVVVLPTGTVEVEVAMELDYVTGKYRPYYRLDVSAPDYTDAAWSALSVAVTLPASFTPMALIVPRLHGAFPTGTTVGTRHSLADVRVEASNWQGYQFASWWLEVLDGTTPADIVDATQPECPDEVMVSWERDATGRCDLVLLNVENYASPTLWRRWKNVGSWRDWDRNEGLPWFSPGWLDADEGHIVWTRDTGLSPKGEVWITSLRWDTTVVLTVDGLKSFLSYSDVSGRVLRELGSWGARRWSDRDSYTELTQYDRRLHGPFVGTLVHRFAEVTQGALTYGVSLRHCNNGGVYLAYGIVQVPSSYPGLAPVYAGLLRITEGSTSQIYDRALLQRDDDLALWNSSDEAWPVVSLAYNGALWWLQPLAEDTLYDEIRGSLCRKVVTGILFNNVSTNPVLPDYAFQGSDKFLGMGLNLSLTDKTNVNEEVVLAATGWLGGAHLTALFYDKDNPSVSPIKTYKHVPSSLVFTDDLTQVVPANQFPRWVALSVEDNAAVDRYGLTRGAGQGADSYIDEVDGLWLAYGKFAGLSAEMVEHRLVRGLVIDRTDFTVDVTGYLHPPFGAGYFYDALNYMSVGQNFRFNVGVMGQRRFSGVVGLHLTGGNQVRVTARQTYLQPGGLEDVQQLSYFPGVYARSPGALVKLRIKRSGNVMTYQYYDTLAAAFVNVMSVTCLRGPLLLFLQTQVDDAIGVACSVGVELDEVALAPLDSPYGQVFVRPSDFSTLASMYASVMGGVTARGSMPTSSSGSLVVGDSWVLPGLMPHP